MTPRTGLAPRLAAALPPLSRDVRPAVERLQDGPPADRLLGWLVAGGLTLLAFAIRIVGLGFPGYIVFDETYYAKDAWSLLTYGYESTWPESANAAIAQGNVNVLTSDPSFIVHPPVGKWLIAAGEWLFGMTPFGWRFAACVAGSLLVGAVVRLARRLSRSTLIGALAGLFVTVDGLSFVMSRIALLDIFQSFFLVCGVACVVADRDHFRQALARRMTAAGITSYGGRPGPFVFRPWLLLAGVIFGLACGTKWNSMFVLAVMGLLVVVWSVTARRLAGCRNRSWDALLYDGVPAFVSMVVVAVVVYVSTWAGWLRTQGGWDRQWGAQHPDHPWVHTLGKPLASLLYYHKEIWDFHNGDYIKNSTHVYAAHPAGWLVMARPIGIDAVNDIKPGTPGCPGPDTCLRVITASGTPTLWWAAFVALFLAVAWWLLARDWRFGVPVLAGMATYVPWFNYTGRSLFFFYAITIIPFTAIGLALVCGLILGPARSGPRRHAGGLAVGLLAGLIVANFAFLYPVLTDALLPRSHWLWRMWFGSWI